MQTHFWTWQRKIVQSFSREWQSKTFNSHFHNKVHSESCVVEYITIYSFGVKRGRESDNLFPFLSLATCVCINSVYILSRVKVFHRLLSFCYVMLCSIRVWNNCAISEKIKMFFFSCEKIKITWFYSSFMQPWLMF